MPAPIFSLGPSDCFQYPAVLILPLTPIRSYLRSNLRRSHEERL